jgi:hypothetical protein
MLREFRRKRVPGKGRFDHEKTTTPVPAENIGGTK